MGAANVVKSVYPAYKGLPNADRLTQADIEKWAPWLDPKEVAAEIKKIHNARVPLKTRES